MPVSVVWKILAIGGCTMAAALLLLWVWTFAFFSFRTDVQQTQWLTLFRHDLISTMQQLQSQHQAMDQRVKLLEGRGTP